MVDGLVDPKRTPWFLSGNVEGEQSPDILFLDNPSFGEVVLSDEELVLASRGRTNSAGQGDPLDELFRRHFRRVSRWCLRFTNNPEDAADLAQEVFAKAFQNLHQFRGQSKFSTWLYVIARNQCLNWRTAGARHDDSFRSEAQDGLLASISDERSGPYHAAEQHSTATFVARVLNETLTDIEKSVFTLHFGQDIPLSTVTRLLGLENRSGAKAYLVSAKRKLARRPKASNRNYRLAVN